MTTEEKLAIAIEALKEVCEEQEARHVFRLASKALGRIENETDRCPTCGEIAESVPSVSCSERGYCRECNPAGSLG